MKNNLLIKDDIVIPGYELEITTSRSSGAGGQHVNKTDTRVTVRWNVRDTTVLNDSQKEQINNKLQAKLTNDGYLIVHDGSSRSQLQNKHSALDRLAAQVRRGLACQKKRMKTRIPKSAKESRLRSKAHRSNLKKMRSKNIQDD